MSSDKPNVNENPTADSAAPGAPQKPAAIELSPALSVRQLSEALNVSPVEIIKRLMKTGIMANINQIVDYKTAAVIATDLGLETRLKHRPVKASRSAEMKKQQKSQAGEASGGLVPRPPVVTIMGHVDHGKTRLLDAIRKTNVVDTEAGGITQHIGAYQVEVNGQRVTFLDTPGHEAFTAMRARGAQVTDITVLVVAADDGVMPQTLEAIDHAKAAGVPIVVAINKIDKDGANPDRIKQQLAEAGLVVEDWGGDVIAVPVSARENIGIPDLLENLMIVAEMEDLKADPNKPAEGTVIESKMDRTRGALSTILVSSGTLKEGDIVVVGETWGRVKAMFNYLGKRIKKAPPSTPVEVLGLNVAPQSGDIMTVVEDEKSAQALIARRHEEAEKESSAAKNVTLSNVYDQINAGKVQELGIILKTDVQGSLEPIKNSLEKLSTDALKARIIHSGTGNITESDVMLAIASRAVVIGFNVSTESGAKKQAEREGISIRNYSIIYNMIEDIEKALKGMLAPTLVEVIDGHAEIRALFTAGKKEKVAGVMVTEGKAVRSGGVRVVRRGKILHTSTVASLRRFKDDVREVATGYECGVGVEGFTDYQIGDILEFFHTEKSG